MDQLAAAAPLSVLARLKIDAELSMLARKRATLKPGMSMFAFNVARVASQIVALLRQRGTDLKGKSRENAAFASDGPPDLPASPRTPTARLFEFNPNRRHSERKKDNTQAMALLRMIDSGEVSGLDLDDQQKQMLAKYSGTGGNLIGADGKAGSAYEYYTPKPIAEGMWAMLSELGFKGGKVLDPCSGVGIFGASAPGNVAMESVELNETSGRINQLVNGGPGYNAIVSPFEAVASRTADGIYDAVISNVPFGGVHDRGSNRKIDPKYQDQPLETYFILRSLEKLRAGGLACFIVPPRVVSAKGGREEQLRIAASYMAEFMGAYRLPNSVFGSADADTITDVIVLRKFSREATLKIEELREQNPGALIAANMLWTEFLDGKYFQGEGRRFVLGEFVAKDPNKFRDVDRVVSDQSIPNIAKLLRKFPGSRIDWKALESLETEPIVYNDGDNMTLAGQTLEMRDGAWVALGKAPVDDAFDAIGPVLASPLAAVSNKVTWDSAADYLDYLRGRSMDLEVPVWLRLATNDVSRQPQGERSRLWNALIAGLATVEVMQAHAGEPTFNYLDEFAVLSDGLIASAQTVQKAPASFSRESKSAFTKARIVYSRKTGFEAIWKGEGAADVAIGRLDEEAQVGALQYTVGKSLDVAALKTVYGADFDVMAEEGWCLDATGEKAMKADDYYTGNYAQFLARIDADIAGATGILRDKLLRQRASAEDRIDKVDPSALRFNLFSPFVTMEEKAEFMRRFMHPAFAVGVNNLGNPYIVYEGPDGKNATTEQKLMSRMASYLSGNAAGRGVRSLSLQGKELGLSDREALHLLRNYATRLNTQFDGWVKANPAITARMSETSNDPERLYFNEVDDNTPLTIPGLNPDLTLHGYQNAFLRKQARSFGGINGWDVGLGKTFGALATVQYVQSIAVKKKTVFVVPNSVLSNWRKEAGRAYLSMDDCLFIGLETNEKTGKASVNSANYARDFTRVLENRHRKIFCSIEAFAAIPFKDETIGAYEKYLMEVDPSYAGSDKKAEDERSESKRSDVTGGAGEKSSAYPYFEDLGIDSLVADEGHCFPSGTLVDGIAIESLAIGDMVRSFNHDTGLIELRAVTDTMNRPAPRMVAVHLTNGQTINCTHDHPFFTESRGYVKAEFLTKCDVLIESLFNNAKTQTTGAMLPMLDAVSTRALSGQEGGRESTGILHGGVQGEINRKEGRHNEAVRGVQDGVRVESHAELEVRQGSCDGVLLFEGVQRDAHAQDIGANEGVAGKSRECGGKACGAGCKRELAADTGSRGEESIDQNRSRGAQGQAVQGQQGRQWATTVGGSHDAVGGTGSDLGERTCGEDQHGKGNGVSDVLQAGLGQSSDQAGDRGGRQVAPRSNDSSEGLEENSVLGRVGVAGVTVLERGGDDRFGGVCRDGLVYDITVDGNHNFFAEGILVHNCFKNSKNTLEFSGGKFLSVAAASQRGLDMQMKAWYVRGLTEAGDGVLPLTATPITNSPLEIYSMLTLAVGEKKVHDLCMGVKGADAFMDAMCMIEDDEDVGIDGTVKSYRIFRGLQNVNLLRGAIEAIATIKTGADVKAAGDDLKLPESPETRMDVQLSPDALKRLNEYKMAYRAAKEATGMSAKDAPPVTEEEVAAFEKVQARFGEDAELIAHPFNLIQKMTALIADPELDERATFYSILASQRAEAEVAIAAFNKLGKVEQRARGGPWTDSDAVVGQTTVRDGGGESIMLRIKVRAKITADGRIVVDTTDYSTQAEFEKQADKAKLELDVTIPPKLAALLANVKAEEATPRSKTGRVKQLVFCDILPLHNKIKRILAKHAGIAASAIEIVSGQSIKNPEQMQGIQDGFNADGPDNKFRVIIANEKAEVGINLQRGTQAIHHMTIGWTPDSQHQRNGRGVRQGNTTARVNIYHYDANGTFDEYKRTLTTKKADWIAAVMDKQGGNEVQVSGGLTADQYDEMIESMGDATAVQAIQDRAGLKERLQRADSARARQLISLQTAQSQMAFAKDFPTAKAWVASQAGAAFDLNQKLDEMRERNTSKMKAVTLIRFEAKVAELDAQLATMLRDLDTAGTYQNYRDSKRPTLTLAISGNLGYSDNNAKRREAFVGMAASAKEVNEDSPVFEEWESQIAQAEAMTTESFKEFVRIGESGSGAYAPAMVQAFKDGKGTILDNRPYCKGMFIRSPKGVLMMLDNGDRYAGMQAVRYPHVALRLADALNGGTVIGFESADYDDALTEAAQIDDALGKVEQYNAGMLFSAMSAEVATRRKVESLVKYRGADTKLPSPYFPYPINPKDFDSSSETLREIIRNQQAIIKQWDGISFYASSSAAIEADGNMPSIKVNILAAHARAAGKRVTVDDVAIMLYGDATRGYDMLTSVKPGFKFPDNAQSRINNSTTVEELEATATALIAEAGDWLVAAPNWTLPNLASAAQYSLSSAYYQTKTRLQDEARRAAALLNPPPAQATPVIAPPVVVEVAAQPIGDVAPSTSGKIGLTGETMARVAINGAVKAVKDFIKMAAEEAGEKAKWRGDQLQWDVTPAAWTLMCSKYPEAAKLVTVCPAAY